MSVCVFRAAESEAAESAPTFGLPGPSAVFHKLLTKETGVKDMWLLSFPCASLKAAEFRMEQ